MTVIVSIKINDGVVMASDSASTFATVPTAQIYGHANKIVNLRRGLPIGAMVTGAGGIGSESIDTLLKDLRRRFTGDDPDYVDWQLNAATYTVQQVADRLRAFLWDEKASQIEQQVWLQIRICGYSAGRPLPEVWDVRLLGHEAPPPVSLQDEAGFGVLWSGEFEALDRLVLGRPTDFVKTLVAAGLTQQEADDIDEVVRREQFSQLFMPAMPIQDATDLAKFLVETTIGFVKFSVGRAKSVGGPVEIASITKHEGFKWVQRKHFYPSSLNP
jgi:hypothetical protein